MIHPTDDDTGCCDGRRSLARNGIGSVTACGCGAITLTVQYLSLRLDAVALRELVDLLVEARPRLDRAEGRPVAAQAADDTVGGSAGTQTRPLH